MRTCIAAFVVTFFALIILSTPLSAQTKSGAGDWRKLDATIQEDEAILRWLNSARSNDFPAFVRLSLMNEYTTRAFLKSMFEEVRETAPTVVMIAEEPGRMNPNAPREYYLVGCVKKPGDSREMRVMTRVILKQVGNDWTILGGGFSPPWNNTVRDCPVR